MCWIYKITHLLWEPTLGIREFGFVTCVYAFCFSLLLPLSLFLLEPPWFLTPMAFGKNLKTSSSLNWSIGSWELVDSSSFLSHKNIFYDALKIVLGKKKKTKLNHVIFFAKLLFSCHLKNVTVVLTSLFQNKEKHHIVNIKQGIMPYKQDIKCPREIST